jgi:hypothetical protein
MSLLKAVPELLVEAAADLETIDSALQKAHTLAAGSTLAVLPAAADEVSAKIAHLFSDYGREYQQLAGQAAVFHESFVQHLNASAGMYAGAEAVNTALLPLQPLISTVDSIIRASGLQGPLYDLWESVSYQIFKTIFLDNLVGNSVLHVGEIALFISVVAFIGIALVVLPLTFYLLSGTIPPVFDALIAIA